LVWCIRAERQEADQGVAVSLSQAVIGEGTVAVAERMATQAGLKGLATTRSNVKADLLREGGADDFVARRLESTAVAACLRSARFSTMLLLPCRQIAENKVWIGQRGVT